MTISFKNPLKYVFGAAAAAIMLNACSSPKTEPTPLEKAQTELEMAQRQYSADSAAFALNAKDSTAAKEELEAYKNLRTTYLLGHPRTGNIDEQAREKELLQTITDNPDLDKLNAGVTLAQMKVDDLTGKTLAKSAKRLADKKEDFRKAQLSDKYDKDPNSLTKEEHWELSILQLNSLMRSMESSNAQTSQITNSLDEFVKTMNRKDSVMNEFNELRKAGIDESDDLGQIASKLNDHSLEMAILYNKLNSFGNSEQ